MALTKVGKEGITGISNASDATAITITSNELVGIGTTSPTGFLNVDGTGGDAMPATSGDTQSAGLIARLQQGGAIGSVMDIGGNGGSGSWIQVTESGNLAANYSLLLNPNGGNVDIGGAGVPSSVGNMTRIATNGSIYSARDGSSSLLLYRQGSDAGEIAQFHYNTTKVGDISVGTSSTTFTTSSDYRLKENVDYDWDATTRLKQLKPARFNFIVDETNTPVDGFLAHEVSSIVPEAITGTKDAMTTEVLYVEGDELPEGISVGDVKEASVPDYQGIDQSKLVPLLVKTILELEARLTAGGL